MLSWKEMLMKQQGPWINTKRKKKPPSFQSQGVDVSRTSLHKDFILTGRALVKGRFFIFFLIAVSYEWHNRRHGSTLQQVNSSPLCGCLLWFWQPDQVTDRTAEATKGQINMTDIRWTADVFFFFCFMATHPKVNNMVPSGLLSMPLHCCSVCKQRVCHPRAIAPDRGCRTWLQVATGAASRLSCVSH